MTDQVKVAVPAGEHEVKETITLDFYYPDHPPRTESPTFQATVKAGKAAKTPCCITGHTDGVEYHHFFVEWADALALKWDVVKGIALGQITQLAVVDLDTGKPTEQMVDVKWLAIYWIIKLTEARGFDWKAFDPAKPETFVDSPQNMIPLTAKLHRLKGHGIHLVPFPIWVVQAWPRKDEFVFSPDEEVVADAAIGALSGGA